MGRTEERPWGNSKQKQALRNVLSGDIVDRKVIEFKAYEKLSHNSRAENILNKAKTHEKRK